MAKPKPGTDTPIGPGVLIDDLPIKDKRKVPSTIVQSLEAIRIKLGGDSSYTCDSVQESIDGITNIYDDKMPASNSILSALNKLGEVVEPGSGGSSDFSTAEVTFVTTGEPSINFAFINVQNDGIYDLINITQSTQTVTVPLYKNKLSCGIGPFYMTVTSTSGNITGSQMDGYIITGNCTINYSLPM